jgi:hypothetical protein
VKNLNVGQRLAILITVAVLALGAVATVGISGISTMLRSIEELYSHNLVTTERIGRIQWLMGDNRAQIMLSLQHDPASKYAKLHDHPVGRHLDQLVKNRDEINSIVGEMQKHSMEPRRKSNLTPMPPPAAATSRKGSIPHAKHSWQAITTKPTAFC